MSWSLVFYVTCLCPYDSLFFVATNSILLIFSCSFSYCYIVAVDCGSTHRGTAILYTRFSLQCKRALLVLSKVQDSAQAHYLDDRAVDQCQGFSSNTASGISSLSQAHECPGGFSGERYKINVFVGT